MTIKTISKVKRLAPYLVAAIFMFASMAVPAAIPCPCAEISRPTPPNDPPDDIAKGLQFSHTEEYAKEFDKAIADAKAVLEKHKGEKQVAVVSDLDETLFDNRPYYSQHPNFKWDDFYVYMDEQSTPLLERTANLLSWARDNGYAIFFVTGRHERYRADTIETLVRGKVAYDGLYMRKRGDNRRAEVYKTEARKQIEESGFKIILSIGDQYSDLYGGYAVDCAKLPNRMYYIP